MNTSVDVIVNKLNDAAREGDIDLLYTLIDEEPEVWDKLDAKPLIETPLHVAACAGKLQFATEIMRLKPSFAWKLNKLGYSPIHLALQRNQMRMVQRFIDIDEELVRAKGKEGITPLHFVSQYGDINMLANFLSACPDSIEDVTVRGETALHIAVKYKQFEALQVLVGWLKKFRQRRAMQLENTVLNWKDEAGNTVLHISALLNDSQALGLLINSSKMDFNAKNLENLTVLDITTSAEMKARLVRAGAKHGSSIIESPTLAHKLRSTVNVMGNISIQLARITEDLTENQRNSLLVVATLVATATYQTGVNPPGGYNSGDNNQNTTSSFNNTTTTAAAMQGKLGKSVLPRFDFYLLSLTNMFAFIFSILIITTLAPLGTTIGRILMPPIIMMLAFCYIYSVVLISPTNTHNDIIWSITFVLSVSTLVILPRLVKFLGLQDRLEDYAPNWVIKSGKGEGRKKW